MLGNEVSGNRQFTGVYRFVAIHNRALTLEQIQQNFDVGVGERYFLLFGISHLVNVPKSYIMFEVSQYDSFGYLFNKPTFISLDAARGAGQHRPEGHAHRRERRRTARRPGLQAARHDDHPASLYTPGVGQPLSTVGTVVPLQKGPADDLFFLCFDQLGTHSTRCARRKRSPCRRRQPTSPKASDIGVSTFDEINATMSAITGVSRTTRA